MIFFSFKELLKNVHFLCQIMKKKDENESKSHAKFRYIKKRVNHGKKKEKKKNLNLSLYVPYFIINNKNNMDII